MTEPKYYQPDQLEALRALLPELPARTAVLAGGTDLMVTLREKHPAYDAILSLWEIPEFHRLEEKDGWLRIGAMVTHAQAAASEPVISHFGALQMACSKVGSQQIRNKGTVVGSLVTASPASDMMPCAFLYGGRLEILGPTGTRQVSIQDFLKPSGKPDLRPNEVVVSLDLPIRETLNSCFVKLGSRREVTIAQISLCVSWTESPEGKADVASAYVGAIDTKPVPLSDASLFFREDENGLEQLTALLRGMIRQKSQQRGRPSKLKFTEAEQLYKERAARGVVYTMAEAIRKYP